MFAQLRWAFALAFSTSLPPPPGCSTLDHMSPLSLSQPLAPAPAPPSASVPILGLCSYVLLLLLLSSLTFSSASSLLFSAALATLSYLSRCFSPTILPCGGHSGQFQPTPGPGVWCRTLYNYFTMGLNDCEAFSSQPTQFQIYSNQDFMLTIELTPH